MCNEAPPNVNTALDGATYHGWIRTHFEQIIFFAKRRQGYQTRPVFNIDGGFEPLFCVVRYRFSAQHLPIKLTTSEGNWLQIPAGKKYESSYAKSWLNNQSELKLQQIVTYIGRIMAKLSFSGPKACLT